MVDGVLGNSPGDLARVTVRVECAGGDLLGEVGILGRLLDQLDAFGSGDNTDGRGVSEARALLGVLSSDVERLIGEVGNTCVTALNQIGAVRAGDLPDKVVAHVRGHWISLASVALSKSGFFVRVEP